MAARPASRSRHTRENPHDQQGGEGGAPASRRGFCCSSVSLSPADSPPTASGPAARRSLTCKQTAEDAALPRVQVISPKPGPSQRTLTLPGNIEAWYPAPIYAQVNGYVSHWYKDYGAQVKAGDVLATIDTPAWMPSSRRPRRTSPWWRPVTSWPRSPPNAGRRCLGRRRCRSRMST